MSERRRQPFPRRGLYALTPDAAGHFTDLAARVDAAIAGGAVAIQYRDKQVDHQQRRQRALALLEICRRHDVPFIVNDDVELAAEIDADGVHIGRDDAALASARRIVGAQRIIGVSCYDSIERARAAVDSGADYVAFGSFHASTTKPAAVRCRPAVLTQAAATLTRPIVAIGGITPENAAALLSRGASLVAVINALFGCRDTFAAAQSFARLF